MPTELYEQQIFSGTLLEPAASGRVSTMQPVAVGTQALVCQKFWPKIHPFKPIFCFNCYKFSRKKEKTYWFNLKVKTWIEPCRTISNALKSLVPGEWCLCGCYCCCPCNCWINFLATMEIFAWGTIKMNCFIRHDFNQPKKKCDQCCTSIDLQVIDCVMKPPIGPKLEMNW